MTRLPISLAFGLSFAMATAFCQAVQSLTPQHVPPLHADQMWGLDLA